MVELKLHRSIGLIADLIIPGNKALCFYWISRPDLACPAGVEPATYGLEGLANLQNTMLNNGLYCPDLGVRQNTGGYGVDWGLV
jgi:hypothetical protein